MYKDCFHSALKVYFNNPLKKTGVLRMQFVHQNNRKSPHNAFSIEFNYELSEDRPDLYQAGIKKKGPQSLQVLKNTQISSDHVRILRPL